VLHAGHDDLRRGFQDKLLARRPDGIFVAPFEQGEIGPDLFRKACEFGLEGMVCKRADRPYQAGRSKHWMKVKNRKHPAMERVMDALAYVRSWTQQTLNSLAEMTAHDPNQPYRGIRKWRAALVDEHRDSAKRAYAKENLCFSADGRWIPLCAASWPARTGLAA
jgi:bifunctional non-homologous end joining protein LigD